ncbi:MAG: tetratricopeptide repeat protein [Bacteroidales bacterium]|nr:tetratricopeptide repeat protein [Bacteroidales bacterium]
MNEKLNFALLIEQYVNDEMDEETARNFLLKLNEDKGLAAEYKFDTEVADVIRDEDTLELRRKLMEIVQESKGKSGILRFLYSKPYQIAAAASFILLLATVALVFLLPRKPSNDRLFSSYYNSEQPLRVTRGSDVDLIEALRLFQKKDFLPAIEYFDLILQGNPDDYAVRFYQSICYIETGQFGPAITSLSQIARNNSSLYRRSAEWYLALCYLKIGETENAVDLFQHIAADQVHDYQKDADQILKELQRM